jgi:hypothetical protein
VLRNILRRAVLVCLMLALASVAHAGLLPDSTFIDGWKLPNGLEVRARHIPRANSVSITVAYRAGSLYESAQREGLADLLAEVAFLAPAGDTPERSRDEMESIRPLGWALKVNEHVSLLTEVAAPAQLAGVLHQVAARMRGVTVSDAELRKALGTVKQTLATRRFGSADHSLYHRVRDVALGRTDEQVLRRASAKGLDGITTKEVETRLRALYVPANAVIAIAGDLTSVDVRRLIDAEFAAIPAGTATPEAPEPVLRGATRMSPWDGLSQRTAVIGLIAPALSDSLHPAFYLAALIAGAYMRDAYGAPTAPLTTRFQYSLLDEPDLVRFYPAIAADTTTAAGVSTDFGDKLDRFSDTAVERTIIDQVRFSVTWMLGGLLSPPLARRAQEEPSVLTALTGSMATRAMWRGDAFWDQYRDRLERTTLGPNVFVPWMSAANHQAVLEFLPRR